MHRLPALFAATVLSMAALPASAQDPAYVNGGGNGSYDPLRASSPIPARSSRSAPLDNRYGVPIAPPESGNGMAAAPSANVDRLQEVERLREQLGRQSQENGNLLPAGQRGALAQLLDQSGTLVQQARAGTNAAGPNPLDFNAVQSDPRVQAGARQAQAAMDTLERSLLPMLQDFKNKFDDALSRANANRR